MRYIALLCMAGCISLGTSVGITEEGTLPSVDAAYYDTKLYAAGSYWPTVHNDIGSAYELRAGVHIKNAAAFLLIHSPETAPTYVYRPIFIGAGVEAWIAVNAWCAGLRYIRMGDDWGCGSAVYLWIALRLGSRR